MPSDYGHTGQFLYRLYHDAVCSYLRKSVHQFVLIFWTDNAKAKAKVDKTEATYKKTFELPLKGAVIWDISHDIFFFSHNI